MIQVDRHTVIQILGSLMAQPSLLNDTDKYLLEKDDFPQTMDKYIFSAIYNLYTQGAEAIRTVDIVNYLDTNSKAKNLIEKENGIIRTFCTVKTDGKTGVEMEALTGVQVTLLTIYDMCKAIDKHMVMTDIHLVEKTGGKSGDFLFKEIKTKGGEK